MWFGNWSQIFEFDHCTNPKWIRSNYVISEFISSDVDSKVDRYFRRWSGQKLYVIIVTDNIEIRTECFLGGEELLSCVCEVLQWMALRNLKCYFRLFIRNNCRRYYCMCAKTKFFVADLVFLYISCTSFTNILYFLHVGITC